MLSSQFISTKEAALRTKLRPEYVAQLCREGKLEAVQIGREWRVDVDSLFAYLAAESAGRRMAAEALAAKRKREYRTGPIPERAPVVAGALSKNLVAPGPAAMTRRPAHIASSTVALPVKAASAFGQLLAQGALVAVFALAFLQSPYAALSQQGFFQAMRTVAPVFAPLAQGIEGKAQAAVGAGIEDFFGRVIYKVSNGVASFFSSGDTVSQDTMVPLTRPSSASPLKLAADVTAPVATATTTPARPVAPALIATPRTPAASRVTQPTPVERIVTREVIERVVSGVTQEYVDGQIASLRGAISQGSFNNSTTFVYPSVPQVSQTFANTAISQRIDHLASVDMVDSTIARTTISDSSFDDGVISGTRIAATLLSASSTTTLSDLIVQGTTTFLGNVAINGTQTLSGALTLPYLTATSTTQASSIAYRLGIGTTSPYAALSVEGSSVLGNSALAGYFTATTSTATSTFAGGFTAASSLNVLQNGRVGIGTAAPSDIFEVRGTDGAASVTIVSPVDGSKYGYSQTSLNLLNSAYSGNPLELFTVGAEGNLADGGTLTNRKFYLFDPVAGEYRLVVDSVGRIGIGTTTPAKTLSVQGNAYTSGTSFFGGAITATSTFTSTATAANTFPYASSTALTVSGTGYLGTLGVGTTTPAKTLSVQGDALISGTLTAGDLVATSTLTAASFTSSGLSTFASGLISQASSTIGDGTRVGGLTINGGATTTGAAYFVSGVGVGVATTVPGVLQTSSNAYIGGNLFVGGNSVTLGNSSSNTLTINSSVRSHIIPDQNITHNLGSPSFYWGNAYVGNLVANNISAASTTISGTASQTFTINSDNATADTEDQDLIFFRGTVVPNALLSWKTGLKRFEFNQPLFIQNASTDNPAGVTLDLKGLAGQTGDLFRAASSTGTTYFTITKDGFFGIGTTTPSSLLAIQGNQYTSGTSFFGGAITATSTFTSTATAANTFPYASSTALTVSGTSYLSNLIASASSTIGDGTRTGGLTISGGATTTGVAYFASDVGVGTLSPAQKFSVAGTLGISEVGSTGGRLLLSTSGSGAVFNQNDNSDIFFQTEGLTKMTIDAQLGYIGIGSHAPTDLLHIATSSNAAQGILLRNSDANSSAAARITLGNNSDAIDGYIQLNSSTNTSHGGARSLNILANAGDIVFSKDRTSPTALVTIKNSGLIGIGTTTPAKTLSVQGDALISGTTTVGHLIATSTITAGGSIYANHIIPNGSYTNNLSSYDLGATGSRWNALWAGTLNIGTSTFSLSSNSASGLGFYTAASGGGTQVMTLTTGGLVGIGNASPSSKLTVGANPVGGTGNFTSTVAAGGTSAVFSDNSNSELYIKHPSSGILNFDVDSGNAVTFSDGAVENLRLTGGGLVGIGTTTPISALAVVGQITQSSASDFSLVMQHMGTNGDMWSMSNIAGAANAGGLRFYNNDNAAEYVRITNAGNVGVGNSSPTQKFMVSAANSSAIAVIAGSTNSVRIGASAGSGIIEGVDQTGVSSYQPLSIGGSLLAFTNSGTEYMRLTGGNLGIGTTSPNALLDLATATNGSTNEYGTLRLGLATAVDGGNSGFYSIGRRNTDGFLSFRGWQNNASGYHFSTNVAGTDTEHLTILNGGNVGIGSTSPGYKLSVAGSAGFGGTVSVNRRAVIDTNGLTSLRYGDNNYLNVLSLENNAISAASHGVGLTFKLADSGAEPTEAARIGALAENTTFSGSTADTSLALYTSLNGSLNERMRITSAGNIGIGTTTPTRTLTVQGSAVIGSSATAAGVMFQTNGSVGEIAGINAANNTFNPLQITTGSTPTMYFDTSGRVGIGTTSPAGLLHVDSTSGALIFTSDDTGSTETTDAKGIVFRSDAYRMGDYASRFVKADEGGGIPMYIQTNESGDKTTWVNSARFGPFTGNSNKFETFGQTSLATASGNVGIGTTTPGYKLQAAGSESAAANTTVTDSIFAVTENTSETHGIYMRLRGASAGISGSTYANQLIFRGGNASEIYSSSGNLVLGTDNTERLRIAQTTGNVGIGTTTVDAGYLTAIKGGLEMSGGAGAGRIAFVPGTASSQGYAEWYKPGGTRVAYLGYQDAAATTNNLSLSLENSANFVVSGGNVGIGTTTPNAALDVTTGGTATSPGTIPTGTWAARIFNQADTSTAHGLLVMNRWAAAASTAFQVGGMYSGVSQSFFKVDGIGNVAIGTSTATEKLTVNGGIGVHGAANLTAGIPGLYMQYTSDQGYLYSINNGSAWKDLTIGGSNTKFLQGGTEMMRITSTGLVGIGTTTPIGALTVGDASGTKAITIDGSASGASGGAWLGLYNAGVLKGAFGNRSTIFGGTFDSTMDIYSANAIRLSPGGADAMTLTSAGLVGVGTTTPAANLDVYGYGAIAAAGVAVDGFNPGRTCDGCTFYGGRFRSTGTGGGAPGSTNVGLYASATNGVVGNYAAIFDQGSVGIGTAAPTSILQVNNGQLSFTGTQSTNLGYGIGKNSGSQLQFNGGTGGYVFNNNANSASLVTILDAGRIGIGTTTPQKALSVEKEVLISGNNSAGTEYSDWPYSSFSIRRSDDFVLSGITMMSFGYRNDPTYLTDSSVANIRIWDSTQGASASVSANTTALKISSPGPISLGSGGTDDRLYVNASGSVGIGTTNPQDTLHVLGANLPLATTDTANLVVGTTNAAGNDLGGSIGFGHNGATGALLATIKAGRESGGTNTGYLSFATRNDSVFSTERMRITSSGLVGVGTSSPTAQLTVQGASSNTSAFLHNETSCGAQYFAITLGLSKSSDCTRYTILGDQVGGTYVNATAGQAIRFRIANSDKMVLDSSGNVSVAGNLTPTAAPSLSVSRTKTTVDSSGNVGSYPSIATSTDGFPVISYYDASNGDLKVLKCGNAGCTSGNTTTTIDSTGDVGYYTSITLNPDGFPVISYFDNTNGDLKVADCANAACSTGTTLTTVDSTGSVGWYSSIATSTNGFAVIAYFDSTNGDLKVTQCGNAACSSGNTTTSVDTTGSVGHWPSITVSTDNFPFIAYYDNTNGDLKTIKCGNAACSASNTTTTIDSTGDVGFYKGVALGTDGFPVIAYSDSTNGDLKVAKCGNAACSSGNTLTTVDSDNTVGVVPTVAIATDGFPVIAEYDSTNGDLRIVKCSTASCSTTTSIFSVDTGGTVGGWNAIKVAPDGYPVVAYWDGTNNDLKVLKCADSTCTLSASYTSGANVGSSSNFFNNVYAATVWAKNTTVAGFDLAESYEVAPGASVSAGDLVAMNSDGKLVHAGSAEAVRTLGVVSTQPGLLLSNWTSASTTAPVALAGRVPVRISLEGGAIVAGDRIALSTTTPGVGRKAQTGEASVGYALEAFAEGSTADRIEMFVQIDTGPESYRDLSTTTVQALIATTTQGTSTPSVFAEFASGLSEVLRGAIAILGDMTVRVFEGAIHATAGIFDMVFAREVHTDKLCVGSVCVSESQFLAMVSAAGTSTPSSGDQGSGEGAPQGDEGSGGAPAGDGSTPSTGSGQEGSPQDTTAPIITILGNNPATIGVGEVYSDLGATVEDVGSPNIGIDVFVDGGATTTIAAISIDTSVAGEHTIVYSATDQAGNTGTANRTVTVSAPQQNEPPAEEPPADEPPAETPPAEEPPADEPTP